jgi:peptidyl-prolyl cis-trans isomerase SurA
MDRDQFQSFLIRNNILPDTLRDQVRGELTWQTVVQRRLRPSVEVSEEDIDEFIGRFESRSGSMQLRVSEIFLSVDSIQDDQRVKLSADRLAGQLRANADFSALARQFSQSATAPVGGDLGWIAEGQLPDELTQALSRMRPGDMYGPIRTFDGYYILWLRDQRQVTLGDATVDLKRLLFALPADATEQQRQQARAQAAALQPRVTGCDQVEPLAAEFGLRGSGDLGTLKLSELPPGLRRTVATLPLGQASDPILVAAGVTLILVCNRQNGGVDRERIRSSLVSQRLDMLSRRYLRDLRKAANVDIRL